jgi:hypothetical protein
VHFEEGDVRRCREDGIVGEGGCQDEGKTGKRKRMESGLGWYAGFAVVGDGGEDADRKSRGQDKRQESNSAVGSENMSGVDGGSEHSEVTSEDNMYGPPSAKKAKLRMEDVRGRVIEMEAEQDTQRDSLDEWYEGLLPQDLRIAS